MTNEHLENLAIRGSSAAGRLAAVLGVSLREPVFMIGTGRCGTTLLARILASHPAITVFPGEANGLWHPGLYPLNKAKIPMAPIEADPESFTECSLRNWPEDHAEKIRRTFSGYNVLTGKKKTLVVKSAMISFMLPTISSIFPGARFIHIYRYGPSVVESYFKKNFDKYSKYKYRPEDYYKACAGYWSRCIFRIEKDRDALGLADAGLFHELGYEDLCAGPEAVLRRLCAFLGLDYRGLSFDLAQIESTNTKVKDRYESGDLKALIDPEIGPAMRLKGYTL